MSNLVFEIPKSVVIPKIDIDSIAELCKDGGPIREGQFWLTADRKHVVYIVLEDKLRLDFPITGIVVHVEGRNKFAARNIQYPRFNVNGGYRLDRPSQLDLWTRVQ